MINNDENENLNISDVESKDITKPKSIGVFKFGKTINLSEPKSNEAILQSYLNKKVNSSPLKPTQNHSDDLLLNSSPLKGNNNDVNINLIEISDLVHKHTDEDIIKEVGHQTNIGFIVEDEKSEINSGINDNDSSNTMFNIPNMELNTSNRIMFNIYNKDNSTSASTTATAVSSPFTYLNNDEALEDKNKPIIEEEEEDKEKKEEEIKENDDNDDNDDSKEQEMEEQEKIKFNDNINKSGMGDQPDENNLNTENNESNEMMDGGEDGNKNSDVEEYGAVNNTTDVNKYVYEIANVNNNKRIIFFFF